MQVFCNKPIPIFATQPHLFKIVDGQLCLNSSDGAHNLFVQETTNRISLAEGNWPEIGNKAQSDL